MSIEDRLITIQKKGIEIKTDIRGAQIASIKTVNTDGYDLEIMNQGLLDPEHSAYGKTAPNLVMTPGPAAKFDKKNFTPAVNAKGEEMPVIFGAVDGREVQAIALKYNNYPTLAVQHGWSQYSEYGLQGGGKSRDGYYILANKRDPFSPFKYRHNVGCSIEDDGSITYSQTLTNNGNAPIPGGLGWHPVFKLHQHPSRYVAVFEDVVPADDTCKVYDGLEIDCSDVIKNGSLKLGGFKSASVNLYYVTEDGSYVPYLKMSSACPVWVLWGKGDGFAIEPWNTSKTRIYEQITNQNELSFMKDKGYEVLEPGESTSLEASVRVFEEYVNYKDIVLLNDEEKNDGEKNYLYMGL